MTGTRLCEIGRYSALVLLLPCAIALPGCNPKAPPMTPEEIQHVARFTEAMSPRCLGRHIMDFPKTFKINSDDSAKVEGVTINVRPVSKSMFDLRLKSRETELARMHLNGKPDKPLLRRIERAPNLADGKVFNYSDNGMSDIGRMLELSAWKDGYALLLTTEATDYPGAGSHRADDPPDDTTQKLAVLLKVYDRVRGRAETEIPTIPGLCIAHGFVQGPANDQEEMSVPYVLEGTPDVFFNFVHTTMLREKDTLLQRSSQVEREMSASGTKTVRKGKRELQSLNGEEWLMRGPTPARVSGTMFSLNANETSDDPTKPFITLDFFNGFRIPAPPRTMEESARLKDLERATLTEAEALGIWDRITATLRVRPGAF